MSEPIQRWGIRAFKSPVTGEIVTVQEMQPNGYYVKADDHLAECLRLTAALAAKEEEVKAKDREIAELKTGIDMANAAATHAQGEARDAEREAEGFREQIVALREYIDAIEELARTVHPYPNFWRVTRIKELRAAIGRNEEGGWTR